MSHTSTYKNKIKEVDRLLHIATRIGHETRLLKDGEIVQQFARNKVEAVAAIKLNGWQYELAINKEGEILYDHWGSEANSFERLGELVQTYNKELILASVSYDVIGSYSDIIQPQENGDIKLVLEYE